MDHLLHLTIPDHCDGRTIKQFLIGELHFSMHQISRVKYRPEGFLVNGSAAWVNHILRENDDLCFALDDPLPAENAIHDHSAAAESENVLPILCEDAYLIAADKPAGMVSHPSHGHHGDSALDLLRKKYGRLYLIGRLDKDTSGVLLFAKHVETASLLSKQKETGELYKTYLAKVSGVLLPPEGVITVPIGIAQENPLKMMTDPSGGKRASTHYRTVCVQQEGNGNAYSILSVRIEHGRTHQIRVHLASLGHPLVGDRLYGEPDGLPAGSAVSCACLHAAVLCLIHPYTGTPLTVRSRQPVPWLPTEAYHENSK